MANMPKKLNKMLPSSALDKTRGNAAKQSKKKKLSKWMKGPLSILKRNPPVKIKYYLHI